MPIFTLPRVGSLDVSFSLNVVSCCLGCERIFQKIIFIHAIINLSKIISYLCTLLHNFVIMNKVILPFLLLTLISFNTLARETGIVKGFDGGMMLHTGFIKGDFPQLPHTVSGMPFGIGGVIRVHLGEHWRVGSEGYMSTVKQSGRQAVSCHTQA